jgi:hypothetical protein
VSLLLLFASPPAGAPELDLTATASISFGSPRVIASSSLALTADASLSTLGSVRSRSSLSLAATADFDAEARRVVPYALVSFTARARFTPTTRPRGKKRRTVVVDAFGAPYGELENARHGTITKELNRPDEWAFALGVADSKADLVLEERIREAQLWRGDQLLSFGPMVRPGADKANLGVSGKGALWHFTRRNIGKADRTNYLPNGDFEDGMGGWDVSWSSPLEPISTRVGFWSAAVSRERALTGERSLKMANTSSTRPKYGASAAAYFEWTVDPNEAPEGSKWTLVGYVFVPSSSYVAPHPLFTGLAISRYSTTETIDLTTDPDPVTGLQETITYPAPIEGVNAQIDDDTPRDVWHKLEVSLVSEPTGDTELVQIRLGIPRGVVYWDRISLTLEESLRFDLVDQATIAEEIVEHLQDPAYEKSDVNIGTDCPLTGVLRDRIYLHSEHPNGWNALEEFTSLDDGFDVDVVVTPTTRTFRTYYPMKGIARPKLSLELGKNVADFAWTFDGENASSSVIVLGQGSGSGREEGFSIDPNAFAGGLTLEEVFTAPPETPIDSLDNVAAERLAVSSSPEVLAVKTTPEAADYFVLLGTGDVIPVRIHRGALHLSDDYRVVRMALNPDDSIDFVLNRRSLTE